MPALDRVSPFTRPLDRLGVDYMITGATAAILYAQPRVTNDLDLVLALGEADIRKLVDAFPKDDFYLPPASVIAAEVARSQRGHFNILHLETGFKADVYLVGADPLHAWALPRRRRMVGPSGNMLQVAPPEYVILRKLEYFREGGSSKHPADIRAILETTGVDLPVLTGWVERLGLESLWQQVRSGN